MEASKSGSDALNDLSVHANCKIVLPTIINGSVPSDLFVWSAGSQGLSIAGNVSLTADKNDSLPRKMIEIKSLREAAGDEAI